MFDIKFLLLIINQSLKKLSQIDSKLNLIILIQLDNWIIMQSGMIKDNFKNNLLSLPFELNKKKIKDELSK